MAGKESREGEGLYKEKKRLWMAKNPEKATLNSAMYYAQARWRAKNPEKVKPGKLGKA